MAIVRRWPAYTRPLPPAAGPSLPGALYAATVRADQFGMCAPRIGAHGLCAIAVLASQPTMYVRSVAYLPGLVAKLGLVRWVWPNAGNTQALGTHY
ncbi:hypothetical protein HaLaN_15273 [Haematococcus lacustris]|uniref:Uncharacterized protein n=1 Tax=Haematococcus lacustris TaxID=44745 RepID=A0A699Z8G7_HAELA|nr:hypothetical protein HaLaN_15273 [Haematococcus lacustris]